MDTNVINLFSRYQSHSASKKYIVGFKQAGRVYMKWATPDELRDCLSLVEASRGKGTALRFRPDKYKRLDWIANGAIDLCDLSVMTAFAKETGLNKGEVFEKIVTEKLGQSWTKDSVPFWEAGDLEVEGEQVQVKFYDATVTTTRQLELLGA